MAMRPRGGGPAAPPRRGGGARVGGVRPVYEDIRPMSEWQQDDETHILNIYLPGFMKEQLRVATEGRNTITVSGERLVAGNKWSRFSEDFQVPENGDINSVRAKFQGGTLSITVPKRKVDKPIDAFPPSTEGTDIYKQPTAEKGQPELAPGVSTSQATDEKVTQPQKPSIDPTMKHGQDGDQTQLMTKHGQDGDQKPPTPPEAQDKAFPAVGAGQLMDDKSLELQKSPADSKEEHDQDGDQRGRSFSPLRSTRTVSQDTQKEESSEYKEKHTASERPDDVRKTMVGKEVKETIGSKELPDVETAKQTLEKDGATGIPEQNADNKELHGAFTKERYKKAVKGLAELNEERQLLVNMGAAMLVIVAFTAYVTYNFISAKDEN